MPKRAAARRGGACCGSRPGGGSRHGTRAALELDDVPQVAPARPQSWEGDRAGATVRAEASATASSAQPRPNVTDRLRLPPPSLRPPPSLPPQLRIGAPCTPEHGAKSRAVAAAEASILDLAAEAEAVAATLGGVVDLFEEPDECSYTGTSPKAYSIAAQCGGAT